jgi:Animal haem peroxidase
VRPRIALVSALVTAVVASSGAAAPAPPFRLVPRSLDGGGNNVAHPAWGKAGTRYLRVAAPSYADGVSRPLDGPSPRYVSNRVFNDVGQNLFSENGLSQWVWTWGQFVDHDVGLRDERPAESAPIPLDAADPLERFASDLGAIPFARTRAAPGTGRTTPRQQVNTMSSYIDASQVYGVTARRLDWLREGRVDRDPTDNGARLLLPGGYLPRADARGDAAAAPPTERFGGQSTDPASAVVAGDVRANDNIALTAVQTLFAREHNRIVSRVPRSLPAELRFQIARRVVGAEIQYVTYTQFLPALGVKLAPYRGYDPRADAGLANEFATVGFRAHSVVHGEFQPTVPTGTFSAAQLDRFRAQGVDVVSTGTEDILVIPLTVAFGNPTLLREIRLGPLVRSLADQAQYRNDEQIDDSLRSVLFQVPRPGTSDPAACGSPVVKPECFRGVLDLGAIDVARGRDHGIPRYNALRRAYGLGPRPTFTAVTGETTESFPSDPTLDAAKPIDDPASLEFVDLRDATGRRILRGSPEAASSAVVGIRRTTLAARLKAIYGSVARLDAMVGMLSEPHAPGSDLGQLQLAMWKRQFEALRDGDRSFYARDLMLPAIRRRFGIDYRHTLAELVRLNTGVALQPNLFKVP